MLEKSVNKRIVQTGKKTKTLNTSILHTLIHWEGCPGSVDYVMIWIKEPFIKNEE